MSSRLVWPRAWQMTATVLPAWTWPMIAAVVVGPLRTLSGVLLVTRYDFATVATGPLMMSLSMLSDTPPQVSTWSPRYCLARCHSAHRVLAAVGQPVSVATPSHRAIHTASGRASEVEK